MPPPIPAVLWQAPAGIGVGQIRNLLNGDIEQRRPPVNRSTRSRDISSKVSRGGVGPRILRFLPNHRRTRSALRAPLVIIVFCLIFRIYQKARAAYYCPLLWRRQKSVLLPAERLAGDSENYQTANLHRSHVIIFSDCVSGRLCCREDGGVWAGTLRSAREEALLELAGDGRRQPAQDGHREDGRVQQGQADVHQEGATRPVGYRPQQGVHTLPRGGHQAARSQQV